MIDFIMGFADMNKWFLSYAEPQGELERVINEHTLEDRTHSKLFHENWSELELCGVESWPAVKTLWWLFHARGTEGVRRFGMEILGLSVRFPDPIVRFSMMEAIEICGDVFFGNTAPLAQQLTAKHGFEHVYFGHYHRERETGHLQADETAFTRSVLTSEQAREAAAAVDRIYDNFLGVLSELLHFGERAASDVDALLSEIDREYQNHMAPPTRSVSKVAPRGSCAAADVSQSAAIALLNARMDRLRRHDLLSFLRDEDTSALERLQGFVALWGIDLAGYKDFNELVLRYPLPASAQEAGLNRWVNDLASHGALYLQDLRALDMDRVLGWDAEATIAFYFLSSQTEVHRRNMAKVKRFAFRHERPVLRYWLVKALESAGEPLFECTAPVALAAEAEHGIRLNYWAGRHSLTHHRDLGQSFDEASYLLETLSLQENVFVCRMINDVFDNIEEQFSLSHFEARARTFAKSPGSLPPPRLSQVVARIPPPAAADAVLQNRVVLPAR
jgi:hypothetical protein